MRYERSSRLFKAAQKVIPGGVNSAVRAFTGVGGEPFFVERAKGAYLYDEDGNKYIDYISSWGPMILGHARDEVVDAIKERADKGSSYGIPTELETRIAELAVSMVDSIDKIRFVNSGTEACMSAVRLARGYTGKDGIIKFKGNYHGHSDAFLIQAGSGASTLGTPNSPGVTQGTAKDTFAADYNDLDSVTEIVEQNKGEIACIIVEPVAGNMGCVPPKPEFIKGLRKICDQHDILLVFDEVMTGFRLAKGGAQEVLGVQPDITCFGKVVGGGLPVGAFGAKKHIMSHLSPEGPVYQAGTLSGNPIAMAAGYTTLKILNEDDSIYDRLEKKTQYLKDACDNVLKRHDIPYRINQIGSMMSIHFCENEVVDFDTAAKGNNAHFPKVFHALMDQGVYLPPSPFESYFLNDALTYEDFDKTATALDKALSSLR